MCDGSTSVDGVGGELSILQDNKVCILCVFVEDKIFLFFCIL